MAWRWRRRAGGSQVPTTGSLSRYAISSGSHRSERKTQTKVNKGRTVTRREKEGGKDFSSPRPSAAASPRGRRGTPGSPRRCAGSRRTPSGPRRSRAGRRRTSARGPPCSRPARRPIVVASPSKALRRWRRGAPSRHLRERDPTRRRRGPETQSSVVRARVDLRAIAATPPRLIPTRQQT